MIDAHVHVWSKDELSQPWLVEPANAKIARAWTMNDWQLQAGRDWRAIVVEAVDSSDVSERLLLDLAGDERVAGVVAWVDLKQPDAAEQLKRLADGLGGAKLVGVRQPGNVPDAHSDAVDAIERAGLILEILTSPEGLHQVAELARAHPHLRIVIDHLGCPQFSNEGMATWLDALHGLGDMVFMKLSGLYGSNAMVASALDQARQTFGAQRLLYGSDWPILLLRGDDTYTQRLHWLKNALATWSESERNAVFDRTATFVYGLDRTEAR